MQSGRICILDIELQGVHSIKRCNEKLSADFIFIRPPTFEELRRRLASRATESTESLEMRMKTAEEEIRYAEENPGFHNLVLVNDDIDRTYGELCDFIFSHDC